MSTLPPVSPPPMPLWVKLFGGVVVLLLLVVAALHLTGRAGHGLH